jgi:hypothetical protein
MNDKLPFGLMFSENRWSDRPWRLVAVTLPLLRVVFEWGQTSLFNLVVLAVFYVGVSRQQRQFGWAYLSLVLINWAGLRLLFDYQLTSPLAYALFIGGTVITGSGAVGSLLASFAPKTSLWAD